MIIEFNLNNIQKHTPNVMQIPFALLENLCTLTVMDHRDQLYFQPLIEARIVEIEKALANSAKDAEAIAPDKAIGRLSRLDSMQMQQMALNARGRQKQEIKFLEEALKRIEHGNYGQCMICRRDIPRERLEYQLQAVTCVSCAGG